MAVPHADTTHRRPLSRSESAELGTVKCLDCKLPLGSATEDRFFTGSAILQLPLSVTCPFCGQVNYLRLPARSKREGRGLAEGMGGKSATEA